MRAVSVFPLDEFRLALKKVYGAAAPKGPFTALSQATLFFSRNSCTIACCNLNQWCQATIPAQGDEFSLTLYDTQRLLDACAYFSGELHLEYETAEKKPHNCDIPYNQARFSCGGREIHQLVFDSDLYPLPKEFQPEQVYQINAGTVFGLFTQVRHAVSSDTNRPWSCCVQFTDHRMYALDGYRLSVRAIPDFEAAKPFQIPEEAMELLSVFADEDCTLSIGREWLSVQNDSKRLIITLDMDKLMNWRVQNALTKIIALVRSIRGIKIRVMNWNMTFKGIDDFYLARNYAAKQGVNILDMSSNFITIYLEDLWKREYPKQDRGFIHTCEWEELTLPVNELTADPPKDMRKAKNYLRLLQEGTADFPPLVCVNRMVIDGQHRFWAYRKAGFQQVKVYQNKPWAMPAAA